MITKDDLKTIRERGYSDDEIWNTLSKTNADFSVIKERGYSLDDVASRFSGQPIPEAAPAQPATLTEGAEDIGRKFLMGGAGGIRSITDVFGANNPVSKAIAGVEDYIAEGLSAESQQNSERISKMFDDAESKGLGAKVAVGLEAFASAPAETLAQVGGYMIPNLAAGVLGKAAKLGKLGMTAAQAATGGAMGMGTAKGEIYSGVTDYLREQGVPEDQIHPAATKAQETFGKNMDQILLTTGIGAANALTGVEKIFTRILTRTGGEVTEKSIASVLKSGLKGAAAETAVEVPQEMQEQVATNIALQREGAEVPTFRGAVQAGAMAAPAAFLLGGAAGGIEVMTAEDKAEQEINRDADKEARSLSVPEGDTNAKVVVNEINRKENAITSLQEELDTLEPTDPRAQQLRLDISSLQKGKAQLKKRNKEQLTQIEEKQAELATAIAAEPTVTPAPAAAELSTTITEPAAPTIREEPQVSPMIGAETTQPAPEAVTPAQPEGIAVGNRIKLGKSPQGYIVEEVIESTPQEKELGEQYFRVKNERTGDTQVVEQRDLIQIKPKRIRAKRGQMTPLPQESQAVFEDVESRVKTFFGGTIPSRVTITNNPNAPDTAKGSYDPETGIIEFNLAFIPKEDNIEDIVTHELGHFMFGDTKVKKAFDAFYNSLTPDEKAQVDKIVQDSYNEETGEVQLEEAQVVAFSSFAKLNPERTSLWNTVLDAIKAALNRVLGTNFLLSDPVRTAIHMVNAARRGYVRGREIPREGGRRMITQSQDARYAELEARAKAGDKEAEAEAQRMVDEAAKSAGYDIGPVWHGSKTAGFNVFDINKAGATDSGWLGTGLYFSDRRDVGSYYGGEGFGRIAEEMKDTAWIRNSFGGGIMQAFLSGNLLTIDANIGPVSKQRQLAEALGVLEEARGIPMESKQMSDFLKRKTIEAGYDGVEYKIGIAGDEQAGVPGYSATEYVVYSNNQIKSADPFTYDDAGNLIPLSQRFQTTSPDIRRTAEKPAIERYKKKSQVAGIRNIGSVIDTPVGIKKKTEDIIKKNVIDIDNVSESNTAKAWNLIGRLERSNPDSGKNAQAINELVRESIQDTQADEIVKQAIGGAITRNELLKYAIKLRSQGDSRMLDYLLNNRLAIASGTIDEGDAGRLLNAFQNLKSWIVRSTEAEQAGFIETAASRFFDTKAPTEEQIQQIKDMLTAVKDTKIDQEKELSDELEKVGAATGIDVEGKVQEAINTATPKRDPWMVALEILKKETGLPLAGFSLKPSDVTAKAKAALRPKLADYRKKMTKAGVNGLEKGFWKTLSDQEDKPGPLAEVDAAINRNLAAIVKDTLIKAGLKGKPPTNTKMTVIEQVASILSNNDLTQERISVLDEKINEAINAKEGAELKAAEEANATEDVIDEIEAKYNGLREAWALAMSRQLDIPISDATLRRMVVDEAKESGIDLNEIADISETDPAVAKARKERLAAAIVAKVANVEEATLKLREGVEGLRLMSFLPTNYKPLFDGLVSAIDSSVSARRTKRKAADALKTAKDEAGNPNKQANSQIKRLAKIQSDTQDWGTTKKDAVREIVSSDLKNTPDLGRKEAWKSMLVGQLKGAGVNDTQAETLADLVWNQHEKNALTREMDALTKAVEKGAIKGIVDSILNTPLSEQQKPGWREGVIKKYLTDAGVPSQKADNIAKLFDLSLQKRFAEAKEKAAEKAISGLKRKMTPQSKRALEALLKAIRAQVMNPGSDPMKEFGRNMGYTGFTAEQVSKIAELDSIIDDDNTTNAEKSVALRQIQGIISQVSLPPRIRDSISAFYVGNALGRITTMSVQLFDPAIYAAFDTAVDSVRAITNPRLLPTLIGNYFENFGRVAREIAFSFRNDVMRSGPLVDYLDTNDLRITKLWQDGQRLWNQGKYAEGLKKMLFGYTTYTFRTLKALDDGAFSLLREGAVSRYVLAAMDAAKIPKKDQIGVLRGIFQAREMDMKQMMAQGVSKTDASVYANERMMGAIAENLSGLKIDSQEVIDSIINDTLSRIGKTRFVDGLTDNKRTEIKDEGALSYVFLKTYEITSKAVQSIPGPGGEAMRIFQRILFGFPLIPARMFNIAAGYTPLTLYRHFLTKNYSLTYGTALQRKQRLIEQMSGAIALAPFLLLRSMSLDDDEDKPIKVYFTGQGPLKSQDKTLHAKWNSVHKPFSMEIKVGDRKAAIDAKASGPLSVIIYTMGAIDDWQIRRRLENQKITDDDWRSVQQKADYIASINDLAGSLVLTTSRRSPTSALMQGLVDFRRYPNDPIASIGAEVSFSALPAVPILGAGIVKNISDFFSEPVDTTTVQGAMLNNIPIAGPLATQPAINAYGQKVGELQFSEKLKKATGVPFTLTSYKNPDDQKLTNLTLKYGEGPEPLRRADVEDELQSTLTDEEWYAAAKAFGDANRREVLKYYDDLNQSTLQEFKKEISTIASESKLEAVSAVEELRAKQD
jgi:predicted metal-dependent hydrolase